jgi:Fur family ferric uptake transcriptional regulator
MSMGNQDLRKAGLKVTLPRVKILQILEARSGGDARHMSAEDVYKALLESGDDVGLATVYRVLTQFEAAGLVMRHNFESGHSVFEISRDDHHDHMVCAETGEVIEFFDERIEKLQHQVAEQHGYDLIGHSLVLYVKKKTKK